MNSHYHHDDEPYVSDARPGPWQRRICAALITLAFVIFCLFALTGCYGTAIDTRSIAADEVTISQNTTWLTGTTLNISAKGWKSDVRGQAHTLSTGPDRVNQDDQHGVRAGPVDSLSHQETPGASAPEPGHGSSGFGVVGNPGATAPGGKTLSAPK